MTGEDKQEDGSVRARENVIHELGLAQSRLGSSSAIMLLEDGTNEPSNVEAIDQLRFKSGRIKETFGDVVAAIRRESGYP
jgi:predicted nucleotide-binding protein